jgi:hypothetical protein
LVSGSKRIVLFDTLGEGCSEEQIVAVLGVKFLPVSLVSENLGGI